MHINANIFRFPDASVRVSKFDNATVIFHPPSHKTHFLNGTSALILDMLSEAPSSFEGFCERLKTELEVELDAEQRANFERHFQRLDELGLIQRLAAPADAC